MGLVDGILVVICAFLSLIILPPSVGANIPTVLRQREVVLNFSDWIVKKDPSNNFRSLEEVGANILHMQLFSDLELTIKKAKVEANGNQNFTWIGEVENDTNSLVVITVDHSSIIAQIDTSHALIRIYPKPEKDGNHDGTKTNSTHIISEIDQKNSDQIPAGQKIAAAEINRKTNVQDKNKDFITSEEMPVQREEFDVNVNGDAREDGRIIDVLVVYTSLVQSNNIHAEIVNAIAYTNAALQKSCASFRYRLVNSEQSLEEQLDYVDSSSMSIDLALLASGGLTSKVTHATISEMRNNKGADLVQMWVQNDQDYCGLGYAYKFAELNPASGFSVRLHNSGCDDSTTAHELGHNLSLSHDRFWANASTYDYQANNSEGYGYVNTSQKIRDIMSYADECRFKGIYCVRIPYFSNPRLLYKGVPMGIPGIADAVKRMNAAAKIVSNYRAPATSYAAPDLSCGPDITASNEKKASPCFVATAAFGSPLHQKVIVLKNFRDQVLLKNKWGKEFVHWYYRHSPPWAQVISKSETLKILTRTALYPLIYIIEIFMSNHYLS